MKTNRNKRRNMNFEMMEKRELFAADLGIDLAIVTAASEPQAMLLPAVQQVREAAAREATASGGLDVSAEMDGTSIGLLLPAVQSANEATGTTATDAFSLDGNAEAEDGHKKWIDVLSSQQKGSASAYDWGHPLIPASSAADATAVDAVFSGESGESVDNKATPDDEPLKGKKKGTIEYGWKIEEAEGH